MRNAEAVAAGWLISTTNPFQEGTLFMASELTAAMPSGVAVPPRQWIPVAEPAFVGNEQRYVNECLESTWISSNGEFLDRFEAECAQFTETRHAVACSNGTTALHLALMALGLGPGDEVLVPTFTYVATANAVAYCGARPVLVDSEPRSWNIDPALLEAKITPRTRGIIGVHIYGHPADWSPLRELAAKHALFVVEDAAQAHGARYHGAPAGSLGDIATFSFFGNKIVTTGEGGVAVTSDEALARKMRLLRSQGMDPQRRYWFPIMGYNYRMTNVAAAIGVAQLERLDWHVGRRREVAQWYGEMLADAPVVLQPELDGVVNAFWMTSALLPEGINRDELMRRLRNDGIETRPFFYPCHHLPMYESAGPDTQFPVADDVSRRGFNLPSSAKLTRDDAAYICERLQKALFDMC
jgi:perosamine synthetase